VVGLVSNTTDSTTSVVPFAVIRDFLEGNKVRLVESRPAPASGAPSSAGGPAPSPAPATTTPAEPATPTALVTSQMAVFTFPVDTTKRWRWNRPGAPVGQNEFSWTVTIATGAVPLRVVVASFKTEEDRLREGNFKSFMEQTVRFVLRKGQPVPASDLELSCDVSRDRLLVFLAGPALAALFAAADSRPGEAHFEIVDPDNAAIQSWTEPIQFTFQFTLVNRTDIDINNVWVAPSAEARFEEVAGLARWAPPSGNDFDLLGDLVLKSGHRVETSFLVESSSCDWVIAVRPMDEERSDVFFTEVDLCRANEVTLSALAGRPKAIVK
jgi:hypothetical protein